MTNIDPNPSDDNDSPSVPGFRTWRGVYWFVIGVFALVIAALTLFTSTFS